MKFNIINSVFVASGVFCAQGMGVSDEMVFSTQKTLEAVRLDGSKRRVLRSRFLWNEDFGFVGRDWAMAPSGDKLVWSATPRDVDFFSAASWRDYLWLLPFNARPRVLLAAYGKRAVGDDSYILPFWSAKGDRVLLTQENKGNYPVPNTLAIWDVKRRLSIWNSNFLLRKIPQLFSRDGRQPIYEPLGGALSPDGRELVCLAQPYNNGWSYELPIGESGPPLLLLHFDFNTQNARILDTFRDDAWFARSRFEGNNQIVINGAPFDPQFAWQPGKRRVVYRRRLDYKSKSVALWIYDFKLGRSIRLTHSPSDEISPSWSNDGRFLFWVRGRYENNLPTIEKGQVMRRSADGLYQQRVFPRIQGVTRLQIVPKLQNWTRFRRLPVQALAGRDK